MQSCDVTVCCNYWNCKEEWRDIQSSGLDRDSFLDLKEVTEQTAVNFTVDVSGENCNCGGKLCGGGWEGAT